MKEQTQTQNTIQAAVQKFIARRDRQENPNGEFDKKGRWFPSEDEKRDCCRVRYPSRAFPYSYMTHCRSLKHVAQLMGVAEGDVRAELRKREKVREVMERMTGR